MKLTSLLSIMMLSITAVLFFQCSKDDQLNQVGTWDAKYFLKQYSNDSLTFESIANVEMTLNSDETGIVRGTSGEGTLEWDLIFSDTEMNLIENYGLSSQTVFPLEATFSIRYKILSDEKDFQEWEYDQEFMLQDNTTIRTIRTWRLTRL